MCSRAVFTVRDSFAQENKTRFLGTQAQGTTKHNHRDRRSATDNDDYADYAMQMPDNKNSCWQASDDESIELRVPQGFDSTCYIFLLAAFISCAVVISSDRAAHFANRRAQVTSMTTPISFLISVLAYFVIYQTWKLRSYIRWVSL